MAGLLLALAALVLFIFQHYASGLLTGAVAISFFMLGFRRNRGPGAHARPFDPGSASSHPRPPSHPGGAYFDLLGRIKDWRSKHKYDRMLKCCSASLRFLPNLVAQEKREYGSFQISSIPAIEVGCRYWAALGMRRQLEAVGAVVSDVPELRDGWLEVVDQARADADLADRIRECLDKNPCTHQNKLGRLVSASGRDTSRLVQTMENLGQVRQQRIGKTYELYLTRHRG